MILVYSHGQRTGPTVATINRQHPAADTYRAAEPWLLLHATGRVDRFASLAEARAEALKSWPGVSFRRGA